MEQEKAQLINPRYILNLDDLPKTIEADGTVWPVYLTPRDTARLFHVLPITVMNWIGKYELPCVKVGNYYYIEVSKFNQWLHEHTVTPEDWAAYRRNRSLTKGDDSPRYTSDETDPEPTA